MYTEEAWHGRKGGKGKTGAVKSVCSGVRVGRGLGLYHKFAQGKRKTNRKRGERDEATSPAFVLCVSLPLSRVVA